MAESTKYTGYKPENESTILKTYDAPLKNNGKSMKVKHKAKKKALEDKKSYRYLGDINR